MIQAKLSKLAALLLLGAVAAPCAALSTDRDQPINIEADQAEVDDRRGLTIYEGAVVVTQGTIRITADKLTVHFTEERELDKAVAVGGPARFRQRPDDSQEYVRASASTMEYHVSKNLIHLLEDAQVQQGGDSFAGNRITYDTRANRVKAQKAPSGGERVRITITPRKKSAPADPPP